MDFHPVFVHFPIAFLTVYGIMEFLRFERLKNNPYWFYVKLSFLVFGIAGAFMALQTGEAVEHKYRADRILNNVVHVHSFFASLSTMIFALPAAVYIIEFINLSSIGQKITDSPISRWWGIITRAQKVLFKGWIMVMAAAIGLASISLTGTLGGILVHGPDADIFTRLVYDIIVSIGQ